MLATASSQYLHPTPPNPILGRHVLFLLGFLTTSINFLEQAVWSATTAGEDAKGDHEVFVRWISEGELEETVRKVTQVLRADTMAAGRTEWELVYGDKRASKL